MTSALYSLEYLKINVCSQMGFSECEEPHCRCSTTEPNPKNVCHWAKHWQCESTEPKGMFTPRWNASSQTEISFDQLWQTWKYGDKRPHVHCCHKHKICPKRCIFSMLRSDVPVRVCLCWITWFPSPADPCVMVLPPGTWISACVLHLRHFKNASKRIYEWLMKRAFHTFVKRSDCPCTK